MHIAVVTTAYPLTDQDMSGTFIASMVHHLPPGVRVTIVTPCGTQTETPVDTDRLRVRCFRYAPRRWQTLAHGPGGLPAALRRGWGPRLLLGSIVPGLFLASLGAARAADLIHANWSPTGVIAGLAARIMRTPVITTLRGSDIALAESSAPFRWILRLCLYLNVRLVTVGDGLRHRAARLLQIDPSRISVIANGVAREFFSIPIPTPGPKIRLLCVGALVPVKGLTTLLDALAELPPDTPVELTLVGEGPERSRIETRISELGLTGRVRLVGRLAPSDIHRVMAAHHIFVLPSLAEGRPNALIEAMAAARAVVASDIPGVREVAVNSVTALLFQAGDKVALAVCLQALLDTPTSIPELGARARSAVADQDWAVTAKNYSDLYAAVLAGQYR